MILAGTGHRPDKLGGYSNQVACRLYDLAGSCLEKYSPSVVISGMALGWDTALAVAAIHLEIPVVAAIPFKGQEVMWPQESQLRYHNILKRCSEVIEVSPPGYDPGKMQIRNQWMVDRCDKVLALWDGSPGGTANCIKYARECEKEILNVWESWIKWK